MTDQPLKPFEPAPAAAGRQVARLRQVLALVERVAGREPPPSPAEPAAEIDEAYERAPPIVQRRFDILAREASAWAAAGVEALVSVEGAANAAAARRLADELEGVLERLAGLLGR